MQNRELRIILACNSMYICIIFQIETIYSYFIVGKRNFTVWEGGKQAKLHEILLE